MNAKEALNKVLKQYPGYKFTGNGLDTPTFYVFEIVPKNFAGTPVDSFYGLDKKTGKVDRYFPFEHDDYTFAVAKPLMLD